MSSKGVRFHYSLPVKILVPSRNRTEYLRKDLVLIAGEVLVLAHRITAATVETN